MLDALHERWVVLLRGIQPDAWQRRVHHPEQKHDLTLDELLAHYAWHGAHHLAHITSVLERIRA